MKIFNKYIQVAFKGMCMGAADVIPGVSGGTIAFLMGIYEELINSIKSINFTAFKLLFSGKLKEFWKHINGTFLISVLSGILISIFSLAQLMKYLLINTPIPLWSFFFGLIFASAVQILRGLDKWSFKNILSLLIGAAIAAYICLATPGNTPDSLWFIFICGAIAICAMILPGISGSFILLLMSKYHFMMDAVANLNVLTLGVFATGACIGIVLFSHFLSWLLKNFYMLTIALLSGFMLGSLIKVWPWKQVLNEGIDVPVLPGKYLEVSGTQPSFGLAVLFVIIGIGVVVLIEFGAKKKEGKKELAQELN